MAAEIIVQRGHRNAYDRAFRTAGARIVEVGYPWIEGVGLTYEWQLEAAFSERTVAVGQLALADADGVPLRRVCELAGGARRARHRRRGGRAAARRRTCAGSSTRALRSSSSAAARRSAARRARAILAGRRELIESVRLQTLDMDVDVEAWIAREGRRAAAPRRSGAA